MSSSPSSTCATDGSAKSSHISSKTSSSYSKRKSKNESHHERANPTVMSSSKPDTSQQQDVDVSKSHLAAEEVDEASPPLTSAALALIPDTSHDLVYTLKSSSEEPIVFYSANYVFAEDRSQAHRSAMGTCIDNLNVGCYQEQEN